MQLSNDERRALAVVLGLLLLAGLARWLERPRAVPLLPDVPALDVAALEQASRELKPAGRSGQAGGGPGRQAGPVDLNLASASELQRLPGVGPAVAGRIVEARETGGPFASLTDVAARVRGVGPAMLGKWEGQALAGGPAEVASQDRADAGAPRGTSSPPRPAARPASASGSESASGRGSASSASAASTSASGSPTAPGAAGHVAPDPGSQVHAIDLNRATPADLEKISGVGPILAGRLVARRDSLGGFRDWAEVDAVPGVGPAMLARLKGLAVLGQGASSRTGVQVH